LYKIETQWLAGSLTVNNPFHAELTESPVSTAPRHRAHINPAFDFPVTAEAQDIIRYVAVNLEGSRFVDDDAGHGPSRYGILGEANHLSYDEVKNLTPDQAVAIYKKSYWDALQIDKLPPAMRLIAFNAAAQFGPQRAQSMIDQAGNNPHALLNAGGNFCNKLVTKNYARYGGYEKSWNSRQITLASYLDNYNYMPTHAASNTDAPKTDVLPQNQTQSTDALSQDTSSQTSSVASPPIVAEGALASGFTIQGLGTFEAPVRKPKYSRQPTAWRFQVA